MTECRPAPAIPTGGKSICLSDFEQASALFGKWHGKFEQLSRGRFEGTLKVVRGTMVRAIAIDANQRVLLRGRDATGLFSVYPVIPGNAASLWQGRQLSPGTIVVTGVETEVDHCCSRRTSDMGVSLSPDALLDAARILRASDVPALPRAWAALSPAPDNFASLLRRLTQLLSVGIATPVLLGTSEGRRLEQDCVRAVVELIFPTPLLLPGLSLSGRAKLVRRAEEIMRSRLEDPVGSIDLCLELGVSDRTLRLAFRERFGLGPMAYYKSLRLNTVRSWLKRDPLVRIAEAARAVGFHHLGNFAADYRRLFGERPTESRGLDSQGHPDRATPRK